MNIEASDIEAITQELFDTDQNQNINSITNKIKELKFDLSSEQQKNSNLETHLSTLKSLSQSSELLSDTEYKKLSSKNHHLEYLIEIQNELKKENKILIDKLKKREVDLNRINEELTTSNTELDQFSYIASHDLKSPLRAISYLTTWILEDNDSMISPEALNSLNLIKSRTKRLEAHLSALFEYTKIGRKNYESEVISTQDILTDIEELLDKPKNSQINFIGLPSVYAPRPVIRSIFMNLVSNAIKHNDKDKCCIKIYHKEDSNFYTFYVQDNGPGIDKKDNDVIFDFFKTLKPRDKTEGSGLGLTIIQKYVKGYGGTVGVESSKIGKGTCFYFTWPKNSPEQD